MHVRARNIAAMMERRSRAERFLRVHPIAMKIGRVSRISDGLSNLIYGPTQSDFAGDG